MPHPGEILRSVAFYVVFYVGTVFYLAAAGVGSLLVDDAFVRVSSAWSRFHRDCVNVLLGIRVRIEGELPGADALIVGKHESFFEAIDAPNLIRGSAVFAKAELLDIPLWGRVARAYGLIPVHRDQGARALRVMLVSARERLAEGRPLIIFPEGTRVPHGDAPPLRAGFAGLYKLLALPVVPIAIDSGPLYHRIWKRKGTITIRVGERIPAGLPRAEVEPRVHAAINALNPAAAAKRA